jgi:hypothetical protein
MIMRGLAAAIVTNLTLAAQTGMIHVVVLEGEGAINNVRSGRAKEPVVRVEDENNHGVAGAAVTFFLPATGPGGAFGDNGSSLTLTTDDRGEAVARGLRPNHAAGTFQIRVSASARGELSRATITETNVDPGSHSSRKLALLAIVGGAAAGGAIAAMHGGKSKNPAQTGPAATVVVAGNPTLGPP